MNLYFRNTIMTALALTVLTITATEFVSAEEVTRVFLFAGDSNMYGLHAYADRIDDYPNFKGAGEPQSDVLFSYILENGDAASNGWVPLMPLREFGPEVTFARRVREQAKFPIAIIKSAMGGGTFAFDWNPDAPDKGEKLYPRTLNLIRDSLAALDKREVRYQLEAVIWQQGECDMLDRNLCKQYADGLTKLVARLRTDLKAPELKWYIGELSAKAIWGMSQRNNLGIFRQQQERVLKADPLLRWVPTSHLAFEVVRTGPIDDHFGTQGQLQLGEAFAAAYLRDIGKPLAMTDRRFKQGLPNAKPARVRLFVLAGQRNMEGEDSFVSEIAQQPGYESLAKDQSNVLFRYSLGGGVKSSSGWEPLGPVDFLGNFGPELSFGARLRKSIDAKDGVAVVKFTQSGAHGPDWFPTGSPKSHRNLYPKLISFIRAAQDDLRRQRVECSLEGIFWHTCENDTFWTPDSQNIAKWLKQLIDRTRADLRQPDLSWFISQQHKNAPWGNVEAVNPALKEFAVNAVLNQLELNEPHVTIIKTSELPHARLHFGTRGTLMLGEKMADAYLAEKD